MSALKNLGRVSRREAVELLFSLPNGGAVSLVRGEWILEEGVTHWVTGASEAVFHSPPQRRAFMAALAAIGVSRREQARAYMHFNAEWIDDICAGKA